MACKYPITSRSYKFCIGCSDIGCCEDAVTSNIPMPEVQSPKNVVPSASEANKMTNNAIDNCTTQQLAELSKLIRDAIADGKFSISEDGCLKPETPSFRCRQQRNVAQNRPEKSGRSSKD